MRLARQINDQYMKSHPSRRPTHLLPCFFCLRSFQNESHPRLLSSLNAASIFARWLLAVLIICRIAIARRKNSMAATVGVTSTTIAVDVPTDFNPGRVTSAQLHTAPEAIIAETTSWPIS